MQDQLAAGARDLPEGAVTPIDPQQLPNDNRVFVIRFAADGIDDAGRALYTGVGPLGMSVDGLLRYLQKQRQR